MEEAAIISQEGTQAAFQPEGPGALPSSPEVMPWAGCSLAGMQGTDLLAPVLQPCLLLMGTGHVILYSTPYVWVS